MTSPYGALFDELEGRARVIDDCAEEIMVLAQSLFGAANRSFEAGDQGSAIIERFRGEGIKLAVDLLHGKAASLRSLQTGDAK